MPMNPRLLRPLATGFNPRQIAGLALWLDGADSDTVTLNGSTVSEWRDKSGNDRHAAQATAAAQPLFDDAALDGKSVIATNAQKNDHMVVSAWPYINGSTVVVVFKATGSNQAIYQRGAVNNGPRLAVQLATLELRATIHGTAEAAATSDSDYTAEQWSVGASVVQTDSIQAFNNGVAGAADTYSTQLSGDYDLILFALNTSNLYGMHGGIAEFLYYDRPLTTAQRQKVEGYLAWKWGLEGQLPTNHPYAYSFPGLGSQPQPSNSEAQDWIANVYANGGTVSTSTANAVNAFCNAIDAAGIRDRFYRLNLFAGTGLNAALVPLYRGPSSGGTQYGNTTDTNNGPFVSGDYAETSGLYPGATNTSKYLNTGFPANTISAGSAHLGLGLLAANTLTSFRTGIGAYNGSNNSFEIGLRSNNSTQLAAYFSRFGTATDTFGDNIGTTGSSLAAGNIVAAWPTMYRDGVATGTDATTSQDYPSAHNLYVFANNNSGSSVINYSNPRLGWYSVGETMTSAQVEDFNDALVVLYSSLGRS